MGCGKWPRSRRRDAADPTATAGGTGPGRPSGDQHEDQFAGVHVAEESHAVGDRQRRIRSAVSQLIGHSTYRMGTGAVNNSCIQPPKP